MRHLLASLSLAALVAAPSAAAEQLAGNGHVIHYSVASARFLAPASARSLGLTREAGQGIVNVTVLAADDAQRALPAEVRGSARTLAGVKVPIHFRRAPEAGSESWIGSFRVAGPDTLRFALEVTVEGEPPREIRFQRDWRP